MGQTPTYALRYPEPGDPPDVPTDMHELALDVENALGSAGAAPDYGTSLPASPADGQEAILVDSLTNPTYQWRFRYNAGSTSPYKWEFIGGVPLRSASTGANEGTASTSYVDLPTVQAVTLARAGEYDVRYGCMTYNTQVSYSYQGLFQGGGLFGEVAAGLPANVLQTVLAGEAIPAMAIAVGQELRLRYRVSAGTGYFQNRYLMITPRRIS